jgi:N-methylhydantoinase A
MSSILIIGVDTGGTFTDIVVRTDAGELFVAKVSGTPDNPANSVVKAIALIRERHALREAASLFHGTTVATNALLERKIARTALITTRGFRDILAIGRQNREHLYSFRPSRPLPLIAEDACFEADERTDWQGDILTRLTGEEAASIALTLRDAGYEAAAVCFLFSYLNPTNEERMMQALEARGIRASASYKIAPEPREFERAACTVGNAAVSPVLTRYLRSLQIQASGAGCTHVKIMQSDGGVLGVEEAGQLAIRTALSGPAGGVKAAEMLMTALHRDAVVTFDMGGTSTDVALIQDGHCAVVHEGQIGPTPLRMAMYDIHTVGAGGGSILRLDRAGALRVGPESAGADPGPAAYGKGRFLTVTDANLVLGRLPNSLPLAGAVKLDEERSRALFEQMATDVGTPALDIAEAALSLANHSMARAIRHVSTERGIDVGQCTLLSFGGAGGLHACDLAEALGMPEVAIPLYPGAFSALGLCFAAASREFVSALPARSGLEGVVEGLQDICSSLWQKAQTWMAHQRIAPDGWSGSFRADMRYRGQAFDLTVALSRGDCPGSCALEPSTLRSSRELAEAFNRAHRQRYGHADETQHLEITAIRLTAAATPDSHGALLNVRLPEQPARPITEGILYHRGQEMPVPVYWRPHLAAEQSVAGPAIIAQEDATTFIPEEWQCASDSTGTLIARRR